MIKILLYDWEVGMCPISVYLFLHKKLNLTLKKAQDISIQLRNGESVTIDILNSEIAKETISELAKMGVKAKILIEI